MTRANAPPTPAKPEKGETPNGADRLESYRLDSSNNAAWPNRRMHGDAAGGEATQVQSVADWRGLYLGGPIAVRALAGSGGVVPPLRLRPGDLRDAPQIGDPGARRRGEPVIAFALILLVWVALRIASWEPMQFVQEFPKRVYEMASRVVASRTIEAPDKVVAVRAGNTLGSAPPQDVDANTGHSSSLLFGGFQAYPGPFYAQSGDGAWFTDADAHYMASEGSHLHLAFGHQMLLMAGLAGVSPPPELVQILAARRATARGQGGAQAGDQAATITNSTGWGVMWAGQNGAGPMMNTPTGWRLVAGDQTGPNRIGSGHTGDAQTGRAEPYILVSNDGGVSTARARNRRFSVDSWVYLRGGATSSPADDSNSAIAGPLPSYGRSQFGAVARYYFAPAASSSFAGSMNGYARISRALQGQSQSDAALGLSARPSRALPIAANVEARTTRIGGRNRLRPAAFVHSTAPPQKLDQQFRLESYAQAGYVGGFAATAFADGQLRLQRQIATKPDLGAGIGLWGGVQKGAGRLDMGPSASAGLKIGRVPARLSVDYRIRIAGDAEPGDGIGITLSSGF